MSVIVSNRKVSAMQFYKTARDLRRDITKMLEQMFSDESKFCYSRGLEYYIQTRILEVLGKLMEAGRILWRIRCGSCRGLRWATAQRA